MRRVSPAHRAMIGLGMQLWVSIQDATLDQAALNLAGRESSGVPAYTQIHVPSTAAAMADLGRENVYATPTLTREELARAQEDQRLKQVLDEREKTRQEDDGKDLLQEQQEQQERDEKFHQEQQALEQKHAQEKTQFEEQARKNEESFKEAHKDDPEEHKQELLEKLEQAKQAAREAEAERQEAERREMERIREEREAADRAAREAADRER
jgi:hypothetical protein